MPSDGFVAQEPAAAGGHQTLMRNKLRNSGLSQAWGGLERRNALMKTPMSNGKPNSNFGIRDKDVRRPRWVVSKFLKMEIRDHIDDLFEG
jgi:hypothetical protein